MKTLTQQKNRLDKMREVLLNDKIESLDKKLKADRDYEFIKNILNKFDKKNGYGKYSKDSSVR